MTHEEVGKKTKEERSLIRELPRVDCVVFRFRLLGAWCTVVFAHHRPLRFLLGVGVCGHSGR